MQKGERFPFRLSPFAFCLLALLVVLFATQTKLGKQVGVDIAQLGCNLTATCIGIGEVRGAARVIVIVLALFATAWALVVATKVLLAWLRFDSDLHGLTTQSALAREAGALVNGVNIQHNRFDFIALLEEFSRIGDALVGQFGDVDQTFDTIFDFDENTEIGQARDLALNRCAWWVLGGQGAPWIGGGLAQAQGDAAVFGVHAKYHGFDMIAFLENFVGVTHALGPA
jgi:hypothetical protein